MRHIYYTNDTPNPNQSVQKKKEEEKKETVGFFSGMSKTSKYILIGLAILVILLILFLLYRSSSPSSSSSVYKEINKNNLSTIETKSNMNIQPESDKLLDIMSNADYNEFIDVDNISETGTIDDIIIEGPQTGKPIGNLRYIYF